MRLVEPLITLTGTPPGSFPTFRIGSGVRYPIAIGTRPHHRRFDSCPISGRKLQKRDRDPTIVPVPTSVDPLLVAHVAASTGLTPAEAVRVVEDVLAFHAEPVEDYVRRRHAHLKTYGAKNAEIFARIATELADRVVAAPPLTERQLRRIVYG